MNLDALPIVIDESQKRRRESDTGDENSKDDAIVEFQRTKQERLSVIPESFDDNKIQRVLKKFNEPGTLPDETEEERKDRLAKLLYSNKNLLYNLEEFNPLREGELGEETEEEDEEEDFYTPASDELIDARRFIIDYSLAKSESRLKKQLSIMNKLSVPNEVKRRRAYNKQLQKFTLMGSQIASTRPVSRVTMSPNSNVFATGSWAGDVKVFDSSSLNSVSELHIAHSGKIGGLHWNSTGSNLVSGGEDTYLKIYNYDQQQQSLTTTTTIKAHNHRVVTTKFHPSDKYVATASFDTTWKLWDVETSTELLLQEGHAKEVYSLAFHNDGALVATGGLDNLGMIWDIRSGDLIMTLTGHVKPVYSIDWSPNGYNLATGSGDGSIHIWDLRKQSIEQKIPAHKSIISSIQFSPFNGEFLLSSSYDKTINMYSSGDWHKITTLQGHTDKILDATISPDSQRLISSGWDRSVKVWEIDS